MLSLYFNCRLTEQRRAPDKLDSGYFYPVTYPQRAGTEALSQYEVLLKALSSYAVIKFDVAIFNMAIDFSDDSMQEELKRLILGGYSAKKVIIRFTRPSTVEGWKRDVTEASTLIETNSPVLVVMNHDHPFIDYTPDVFTALVEKVFPESESNFGKVLYYSHAPEVISWAVNGRGDTKFTRQCGGIFKSDVINHWIDSICVMTLATLGHIWSSAKYNGSYIGRIDWLSVEYSRLGLTAYVFPREFFKHFDGYGHLTGMRLISDISTAKSTALHFPSDGDINEIMDFYYQRWVDCYLLAVRDSLRSGNFFVASTKSLFVKAIEESLDLFRIGYLEADVTEGLIHEQRMNTIEAALRSRIYYFGNHLFDTLNTDIRLLEGDAVDKFKKLIPFLFISLVITLKRLVSRLSRIERAP